MRILFVCLGNICRSPTAEGVARHIMREEGLADVIELDSAGTGGWHVGAPPDARATEAARQRSVALEGAARQFSVHDFERFDLILAMDAENLDDILAVAPSDEARAKVRMLREFDPESEGSTDLDVPDPYYGGSDGFDEVLDMVVAATYGLIDRLREDGLV